MCRVKLGEASNNELEVVELAHDPILKECSERRRKVTARTREHSTRTLLPIESEQGVVGLLELHTRQPLGLKEQVLVTGLLRILKNHLGLLDYGERDTLTGLLNRKTFERVYDKLSLGERARPSAHSQPCWLGVIDIDKFKSINDSFGHLFGDEVLLLVARLMQEAFRGGDRLFRFGGEEFVVLLEGASVDGALIAFERLRTRIESHRFPQVGRVTISLGYTRMDASDASSNCLERADAALYYAKQHGRNQVQSHEVLLSRGHLEAKVAQSDVELF
jgi:diguanylate cyclase (GGDEF)-like protein